MITKKLINQLKSAKAVLQQVIKFDKKNNINPKASLNFALSDYELPNDDSDKVFNIASLLSDFRLREATNIDIKYIDNPSSDTKMLVLSYKNKPAQYFSLIDTLDMIDKLIKLGAQGITKRLNRNVRIKSHINYLEDTMDL